ncbi:hypothetical protein TWF281_003616 [Arthrobotrys megalospora]
MTEYQSTCFSPFSGKISDNILGYLRRRDQVAFARCSKQCHALASPTIFKCLKVYKNETIQLFAKGNRLEPMRKYVQLVKIWAGFESEVLVPMLNTLSIFPNLSKLEIRVETPESHERNIYITVFSLLSTLSYYEGLRHLAFVCSYDVWSQHYTADGDSISPRVQDPEPPTHSASDDELVRIVLGKIHFPKHLESLKIWTSAYEPIYLLPSIDCKDLTRLSLREATAPIVDPRQPSPGTLELTQIKMLHLNLRVHHEAKDITRLLAHLPKQFPNLEFLEVHTHQLDRSPEYDIHGFNYIPDLPNLVEMRVPWPRTQKSNGLESIYRMEVHLRKRIEKGSFQALRKVKLFGVQYRGLRKPLGAFVECSILPSDSNHSGSRGFKWEGDTKDYTDIYPSDEESGTEASLDFARDEEEEEDMQRIRDKTLTNIAEGPNLEYLPPDDRRKPPPRRKLKRLYESPIQRPYRQIQELPTEILYSVLGYLGRYDLKSFSSCSRFCYFVSFPIRFCGVFFNRHGSEKDYDSRSHYSDPTINKQYYRFYDDTKTVDDGPYGYSVYLRRFSDGQCFAPLRHHIQNVTIYAWKASDVFIGLSYISQLSNVTSLTIRVKWTRHIERQIYVALLTHLPNLPYYNSLRHIGIELKGYDKYISRYSKNNPIDADDGGWEPDAVLREGVQREAFELKLELMGPDGRRFFGQFITENDLSSRLLQGNFQFPANLEYLKLDIPEGDSSFCLPFLQCKHLTALHLRGRNLLPIRDPTQQALPEFPKIQALALCFSDGYTDGCLATLPKQFPNVKLLSIPPPTPIQGKSWISPIPKLPSLEYLELPAPQDGSGYQIATPLRTDLPARAGDFPTLRIVKVSKSEIEGNGRSHKYWESICRIQRDKPHWSSGEGGPWFNWQIQENGSSGPLPSCLDDLWSAGGSGENSLPDGNWFTKRKDERVRGQRRRERDPGYLC